jgi:hypothetical protein
MSEEAQVVQTYLNYVKCQIFTSESTTRHKRHTDKLQWDDWGRQASVFLPLGVASLANQSAFQF